MGWTVTSNNVEKVEDRDPNLYVKRCEAFLREDNFDNALFEIDKAIGFSNSQNRHSYENQKKRILSAYWDRAEQFAYNGKIQLGFQQMNKILRCLNGWEKYSYVIKKINLIEKFRLEHEAMNVLREYSNEFLNSPKEYNDIKRCERVVFRSNNRELKNELKTMLKSYYKRKMLKVSILFLVIALVIVQYKMFAGGKLKSMVIGTNITLDSSTLQIGEERNISFNYYLLPPYGIKQKCNLQIVDPTIVKLMDGNKIKALKEGQTKIRLVIDSKVYKELDIKVVNLKVEDMRVSYQNELQFVGDSVLLNIDIKTNIPDKQLINPVIKSLNTKVVKVIDGKTLKAVGVGYAEVVITAGGMNKKLAYTIKNQNQYDINNKEFGLEQGNKHDNANGFTDESSVRGGVITDGKVLRSIRTGKQPDCERIVFDIYEYIGDFKDNNLKVSDTPCYYDIKYNKSNNTMTIVLSGVRFSSIPRIINVKTPLVNDIKQIVYEDDSAFGYEISFKQEILYKAYVLQNPGRVVIDIKSK